MSKALSKGCQRFVEGLSRGCQKLSRGCRRVHISLYVVHMRDLNGLAYADPSAIQFAQMTRWITKYPEDEIRC